jgi:hypothetical protein
MYQIKEFAGDGNRGLIQGYVEVSAQPKKDEIMDRLTLFLLFAFPL